LLYNNDYIAAVTRNTLITFTVTVGGVASFTAVTVTAAAYAVNIIIIIIYLLYFLRPRKMFIFVTWWLWWS